MVLNLNVPKNLGPLSQRVWVRPWNLHLNKHPTTASRGTEASVAHFEEYCLGRGMCVTMCVHAHTPTVQGLF